MPGALFFLFALGLAPASTAQNLLTLEIRTYRGLDDVSDATRVVVHRAGERDQPVGVITRSRPTLDVAPGIYDAQAVLERSGRVIDIRWAERLVVMAYPDESGHHFEVINFANGFGALQVRAGPPTTPGAPLDVALFTAEEHSQPAAVSRKSGPHALFVVRAGRYDLLVSQGGRQTWHAAVDVPRDRTRLWIVP